MVIQDQAQRLGSWTADASPVRISRPVHTPVPSSPQWSSSAGSDRQVREISETVLDLLEIVRSPDEPDFNQRLDKKACGRPVGTTGECTSPRLRACHRVSSARRGEA